VQRWRRLDCLNLWRRAPVDEAILRQRDDRPADAVELQPGLESREAIEWILRCERAIAKDVAHVRCRVANAVGQHLIRATISLRQVDRLLICGRAVLPAMTEIRVRSTETRIAQPPVKR